MRINGRDSEFWQKAKTVILQTDAYAQLSLFQNFLIFVDLNKSGTVNFVTIAEIIFLPNKSLIVYGVSDIVRTVS